MSALLLSLLLSREALPSDAVHDAIKAEITRAKEGLVLPDVPGPYHISSLVYDMQTFYASATLGSLVSRNEAPFRSAGFTVRTGSTALDNTNFESSRSGLGSASLVQGDDTLAIRKDAWLKLDQLYKQSVEALAAKEAAMARRAEPDDVPDFAPGAPGAPVTADPALPVDGAPLQELVIALSAIFLERPEIEWSSATISAQTGRRLMLDTGGTDVVEPFSTLTLRVVARARAEDGSAAVDHVTHIVRDPSQLPPREELLAQVRALADRLSRWRTLPVLEEEYVGPVLLTGEAAVDIAERLIAPALLGTPPEMKPPRGSRVVSFGDEQGVSALQLKRRLLPSGFTVVDDPGRDPARPSSYRYDSEGVPAQRVELVTDGIVRNHLMSRIPSEAIAASNGHGRAAPGRLVRAAPSDLTVTARKTLTEKAIHKVAIKLAAAYGDQGAAPSYARVERLADPTLRRLDGGPRFVIGEASALIPPPLAITLVRKDGSETSYRSASLSGLDVRALKEIVATGAGQTRSRLMERGDGGINVTLTSPDLLFGELVIAPAHEDAEKPPLLGNPIAR